SATRNVFLPRPARRGDSGPRRAFFSGVRSCATNARDLASRIAEILARVRNDMSTLGMTLRATSHKNSGHPNSLRHRCVLLALMHALHFLSDTERDRRTRISALPYRFSSDRFMDDASQKGCGA